MVVSYILRLKRKKNEKKHVSGWGAFKNKLLSFKKLLLTDLAFTMDLVQTCDSVGMQLSGYMSG